MSKNNNGKNKALLGLAGVVALVCLKFQGIALAALKALSLFKISWLFSSLGTMFLTLWLYLLAFGWKYAIALIILLYIHEMGHYIFASAMGLKPQLPKFAFFVAWVLRNKAADQASNAWVSFAGPLIGSVGSAVMYWTGAHLDNRWLMAAGSTGFWLNLLQLIPAKPLDGGYVIGAVSKWLLIPGVVLVFLLAFMLESALFFIIGAISLFSLINEFRKQRAKEQKKPQATVRTPTGTVLTVRDLERAMQAKASAPAEAQSGTPNSPSPQSSTTPAEQNETGQLQSGESSTSASVPPASHEQPTNAGQPTTGNLGSINASEVTDDEIPATFGQRLMIGFAYVTLVGILGYLYALTGQDMRELRR